MTEYLYVSVCGDNKILRYERDLESGLLKNQQKFSLPGGPAPLAIHPNKKNLYAGLRTSCEAATLQVNQQDGSLSLITKTSLNSDPCFLGTDRQGNFLFSTYYKAGRVEVTALDEQAVANDSVQLVTTDVNAHSIYCDPTNQFAFSLNTGPNKIFQFEFNGKTGCLTSQEEPSCSPPDYAGPRHGCFHPNLPIFYTADELGNTLSRYNFDQDSGLLNHAQSISTIPSSFNEKNTCADIKITPTGRFLYVSNRGHDSIACFAVNNEGITSLIDYVPTEKTPRSFEMSPDGKFIYSAGEKSGYLAVYSIDQQTGLLEPIEKYLVGERPMWVLATSF